MDMRPPLRAHAEWLAQLREYVYGAGTPDVRLLVRDDQCELGRWIYNDAAHLRHLPEYEAARQAHASFHAEAAEVVRLMQAGRRHEAALAIERGGPLQSRSATMIRAFLWLGHRLSQTPAARPADKVGPATTGNGAAVADPARRRPAHRLGKADRS